MNAEDLLIINRINKALTKLQTSTFFQTYLPANLLIDFAVALRSALNRRYGLSNAFLFIFMVSVGSGFSHVLAAKEASYIHAHRPYQLLLAGGALKTCSSYAKHNCEAGESFSDAKQNMLYEVNEASILRLEKFIKEESSDSFLTLAPIVKKLKQIAINESIDEALTRSALFNIFEANNLLKTVKDLPDAPYFALLDHLELKQIAQNGKRLKEHAKVAKTKNIHSKAIYQRFVSEVEKIASIEQKTPHILVVTASSRDAFEVADFYESSFASLGVKTTWIGLDQAFADALEKRSNGPEVCENLPDLAKKYFVYDRPRVYPDRAEQQKRLCENPEYLSLLIEDSQGIFFNGGDQSKTLNSLMNSNNQPLPFWQEVMRKVSDYKMIVGGTSAGTAVQAGNVFNDKPIPMISNGRSENAIKRGVFAAFAPSQRCLADFCETGLAPDDVTFLPTGGSGLFDVGTLDTHFSERDREGRLIALVAETSARVGMGVDETTALLYRRQDKTIEMEVIGAAGVFVVDGFESVYQKTSSAGIEQRQYAGFSHYFYSGNQITWQVDTNEWKFKDNMKSVQEQSSIRSKADGVWRRSTRKYCGSKEMTSWIMEDIQYVLSPQSNTQFFVDNDKQHCGYLNLPFLVSYQSQ